MNKKHPWYDCHVSIDGKIMTPTSHQYKEFPKVKTGYHQSSLKDLRTGQRKTVSAHRLVWEAFVGEIPDDMQINHKDGNKSNNCLSNLEVVTPKQNMRHAVDTGLKPGKSGEENSMAKLTNQEFYNLIHDLVSGMSNDECAQKYGLHSRYVSLIRHRKRAKSIWDLYQKNTGIGRAPKSDGLLSKIPMGTRIHIISQLPFQTNKALARLIDVDPSVISNVRYKKAWLDAWEIFEEGATTIPQGSSPK